MLDVMPAPRVQQGMVCASVSALMLHMLCHKQIQMQQFNIKRALTIRRQLILKASERAVCLKLVPAIVTRSGARNTQPRSSG